MVVVPDQTTRDLLMKSRFKLRNPHSRACRHFDRLKSETKKLAEAHQELKARREKGVRGLTIQGLIMVHI